MELPFEFVNQMETILEKKYSNFLASLEESSPVSLRLNNFKVFSHEEIFEKTIEENIEKVKWISDLGIYLKERPIFTLDPIFQGGGYYVQEASSMFLATILRQIISKNDCVKILDLCAAPGGKSTLMLSEISKDALLVTNEVIKNRYQILRQNLTKWGNSNIITTNHDVEDFKDLTGFFDIVLVDAPCSGEGLFRKDKNAIKEWSISNVSLCASRQKRILAAAQKSVNPNGYLIYSTCTYNDLENDKNIEWLKQSFGFQPIKINTPADWNIQETQYGYQFFPHKVRGEGFFISVLRQQKEDSISIKKESKKSKKLQFKTLRKLPKKSIPALTNWIETPKEFSFYLNKIDQVIALQNNLIEDFAFFDNHLYRKNLGISIGSFKGLDFIPSHELALSNIIKKDFPKIELGKPEALRFLKKESILIESNDLGWKLITYKSLNLGWVKLLKNRVNNYYPKNWRILMRIQ